MGINKFNHEGYFDPTAYEALSIIDKEKHKIKSNQVYRPIVYITSSYCFDVYYNTKRFLFYSRFAVINGYNPIVPHFYYPKLMNKIYKEKIELALICRVLLIDKCNELWVFGKITTKLMEQEIIKAKKRKIPIKYFNTICEEVD